ncbi:hypothetical protein J3F84DRAFT_358413 [Trichoderma pleuroticola]
MQLRTWACPATCVVVFVAALIRLAVLPLCFFFYSISASPPFSGQATIHTPSKCRVGPP